MMKLTSNMQPGVCGDIQERRKGDARRIRKGGTRGELEALYPSTDLPLLQKHEIRDGATTVYQSDKAKM